MGKLLPDGIGDKERAFIEKQKVFFVATAPLSAEHDVNLSPKAPGDSVQVLNAHKVAYADLTGSGSETAAHVLENGRMTLMFCNLEVGPPKILRLHGQAQVVLPEQVPSTLLTKFPTEITKNPGFRAVYVLDVDRVTTSCGYSIPIMEFQKHRHGLQEWSMKKGVDGMTDYEIEPNSFSINGLPSLSHQRHPDMTICPNPTDGYILGKQVTDSGKEGKHRTFTYTGSSTGYKYRVSMGNLVILFVSGMVSGLLAAFAVSKLSLLDGSTGEL